MSAPPFARGVVVGYNPQDQDSVVVMFPNSGQIAGYPVKVLHRGAADFMRIDQDPLPTRGTWGLVAFPEGDVRNGIWLGSYYPAKANAVTSPPGDPTVRYHAHYSGDWDYLDGAGVEAHQWADGSYFVAGSGALPTAYRQTVDENQTVSRLAYARSARIPSPPSAFPFTYVHESGTSISVDVSGNVTVALAASKVLNITQGGAAASDFLALVSKLVTAFNNHVHTGVQSGGSNTGTPASPWSSTTVNSTIIDISN